MDQFITELAGYGPVTLMAAFILFLLREPIASMLRGSSDTAKLIQTINENSKAMSEFGHGLSEMADQFEHNSHMFTNIGQTATEMNAELRAIKDVLILRDR